MLWLSYELPSSQAVSIDVTDLLGRPVASAASSDQMAAGRHLEEIDLSHAAPGVYLVQLQTLEARKVIKVVKQ